MKTVNINLENQNILVIGGGKKAYEMGKQFENVKYLSPNFIDEIEEEKRIYKHYEKEDIKDYFLIIAASVKNELNHQIVQDCKEQLKCCASIINDDNVSISFLHEYNEKYLQLGYQTHHTTNTYYEIFDTEFKNIYKKHEPVLQDLEYIFSYLTTHFEKYAQRQEIINTILEKDSTLIHTVVELMKSDVKQLFCFKGNKTIKNIDIVDTFFKTCENKYPYMFKDREVEQLCDLLELNIDFIDVSLDCFSLDEIRDMMKHTPYYFYIFDEDVSKLREKKRRCAIPYQINETIPDINKKTCLFTLLNEDIDVSIFRNLDLDLKCLLQQDFFIPLLKEKLNIK